jgi:predicted nucleic acid-binding protein
MALKQLLDTNVILYFLAGKLSSPLPDNEYYVSVITQLELLSFPLLTSEVEAKIEAFLDQIEIIGLTPEIIKETVQIRRKHKLKLPDSIIIATAKILHAAILTNDQQFINIPSVKCQSLQLVP